jgi:hypothetical protein
VLVSRNTQHAAEPGCLRCLRGQTGPDLRRGEPAQVAFCVAERGPVDSVGVASCQEEVASGASWGASWEIAKAENLDRDSDEEEGRAERR